ncbi:alpha/beta hydrolase [Desulfobotulus sp. H1]|uniref:Alpha/beta hydrolase n=1 Tax=Desulfobotulus pelophilus TaxID=2823377 RepID=A0ABT3N8E6_9BACT|nr:alpha/beta hydrolase [Desulfobotulus pelophilus]MCW7753729.1 alpha/beta hydrolase [Desulfobotulus pelophilus]
MKNDSLVFVTDASFLKAKDGVFLRYHIHLPAGWYKGDPLVLILTGRAECLDKYDRMAALFSEKKVAVVRKDWRGQGGSGRMLRDPQKGHVENFELYRMDLLQIMEQVVAPLQPGRVLLLGHSMGSHLALQCILQGCRNIHAAVLGSPMFSIDTGPLPWPVVSEICRAAVRLGQGGAYIPGGGPFNPRAAFVGNNLTHDEEHFYRFQNFLKKHRSFQMGAPTLGWVHAADVSMQSLWDALAGKRKTLPLLILSGGEDRVVHPEMHRKAVRLLPGARHVIFPGGRHEIYMETRSIREKVWQQIEVFLMSIGFFKEP